ncbi:zinc knuckle CX2CX4HX4C containing protein [Tanacetum coccineum]|uniref:Zinc knuckle CX2CX4HX4C containing protein n=1 Tax=Tanacetum coccineum TaxID=301880 RepID=A0ABQ4XFM5_9ASTR
MKSMGESTVREDSIRGIANSFSKLIDEINESATNHAARDEQNHVWNGAAPMPCVPGMVNVAKIFGVPLKTFEDIDKLTKGIELGKYEVVCGTCASSLVNSGSLRSMAKDTPNLVDTMYIDESPIFLLVSIQEKPSSYVGATGGSKLKPSKSKANFRLLFSENLCEGVNFSIPRKVVETISTRFVNTLYGYFLGKRIAFPVVECYVRNNKGKYGLTRIMMNSKGLFFFQFKTSKGLEDVLENGPWMICNSRIILKKWSMNTRLCKEELTRIPVWVKIYNVYIQVFSEDGLSIIASQIAKPIMLDSYTSSMCIESWGRRSGFTIETVNIEYEWKLPRCDPCKIFGHVHDNCPNKVSIHPIVDTPIIEKTNDGFQTGATKKNLPLKAIVPPTKECNISMSNSYAALDDEIEEEVKNVYDESANLLNSTKHVKVHLLSRLLLVSFLGCIFLF